MASESLIAEIARSLGATWPRIEQAAVAAENKRDEIARALASTEKTKTLPADTAFVVFGSLARGEWTQGSDVDWTLMVDGMADAEHIDAARDVSRALNAVPGYKPPGPTGMFGGLSFSHDIVHRIGGEPDTNKNTTRRILLLLESRVVAGDPEVRERVVRSLLDRYVREDVRYRVAERRPSGVPRFLLNDMVRFWRTMAVDYASKRVERDNMALRHVKLRMSRKLLFAAGLWWCLSGNVAPTGRLQGICNGSEPEDELEDAIVEHLLPLTRARPLETLARAMHENKKFDAARKALTAYDNFLGILDDKQKREGLEKVTLETAGKDPLFIQARDIARSFQEALDDFFFTDPLLDAVKHYGVF